jgi:hypothetical protein
MFSSENEPVDSTISEEIKVINLYLKLSMFLTRKHSKEIGQNTVEFTIPEKRK